MKKIPPLLFTELRKPATHLVLGWLIERPDGFKIGFTSGDVPFELDGVEYEPTNAFSGMAAAARSNLSVDNMSAVVLTSDKITVWDLQAGMWDNSLVQMFWVNPHHPEYGTLPLQGGRMGEVVIRQGNFECELRSPLQRLQQPFGEFYTLECSATLGDDRCKVWLDAEEWQPNERYIAKAGADAGIGSYVRPKVQNGFWYQCVSAQGQQASLKSNPLKVRNADVGGMRSKPWGEGKYQMDLAGYYAAYGMAKKIEANPDWKPETELEKKILSLYGIGWAPVSIEGAEPFGGSFYRVENVEEGSIVQSELYLTPTKEGKVPLSAPPGVQPLTITNVSSDVTYAMGYSGAVEPNWPTEVGAEVADGQLVWRCIRARRLRGTVTNVFTRSHFTDTSRIEPYEYWRYGVITWLSGKNKGIRVEVRAYSNVGGGGFALLEQMPGEIQVGDEYEVVKGCAKTRQACKELDNIHNFRGFPDMPTEEKALATANATASGNRKKQDSGGS